MKVLHLSSEYPPAKIYGLGRFVDGLARAQAALGHDVSVLTNSAGGGQDGQRLEGVCVHRIRFPNPPRPPDGHGEVLQFNHGLVERYFERRKRFQEVEIVASHDWLTALAAREIAGDLGARQVMTFHDEVVGKHFGVLQAEASFVRDLEALTAHDATRVIANSRYVAEQIHTHYGVPQERISTVLGGIDPHVVTPRAPSYEDRFRSVLADPDEVLVLYVGRLDAEKGLETLCEAALQAAAEDPRLRFVFAGSGRLEDSLRARLRPLEARASFLGYVKGEVLAYLYRAADVVAIPSAYEPFGLVALEALLAESAVLVAETGGLKEIVRHDRDGWVAPAGCPRSWADALLRLASDPTLRTRLAVQGSRRARDDFSWSGIAQETMAVYEQALREARRVPCAAAPSLPVPPSLALVLHGEARGAVDLDLDAWSRRLGYPVASVQVLPARHSELQSSPKGLEGALAATDAELVCVLSGAIDAASSNTPWAAGLVWLLRDRHAASASPRVQVDAQEDTPGAGLRRIDAPSPVCFVARRQDLKTAVSASEGSWDNLASALGQIRPGGHWEHSVLLQCPSTPSTTRRLTSVLIVACDGLALTQRAIEAVEEGTEARHELIVVDNGSADGTQAYLESLAARHPARVRVIRNQENRGYPVAANQGIAAARGSSVVLLNNDTEVRPGWLTALLTRAQDPNAGIVAPKILNPDLSVQNAGGILHHPDGSFTIPHEGEDRLAPPVCRGGEVESAAGPCMLLTPALLERVGGFDEAYSPAYYEDSDLCQRARAAGLTLLYEPQAEVIHQAKGTAEPLARAGKLDLHAILTRNAARYYQRWGEAIAAAEAARQVAVRPKRQRVLLCYRRSPTTTAAYLEAALRQDHEVITAGPGQELDLGEVSAAQLVREAGGADLLLAVEGENYAPQAIEDAPCPTAWWAIDTHLHARSADGWHFQVAPAFDHVFVAQRDAVEAFRVRGLSASWLPLACDPRVHRRHNVERDLDLVFVGHVRPFHQRRRRLLDRLSKRFAVHEAQGLFLDDMAARLSRGRIAFNASLAGDLNMRVFEALSVGTLLVTDRIDNGLEELFADGEHLALYRDETLEDVVAHYLARPERAAEIAARGQRLVQRHHTYRHRAAQLLEHMAARTPAEGALS